MVHLSKREGKNIIGMIQVTMHYLHTFLNYYVILMGDIYFYYKIVFQIDFDLKVINPSWIEL